MAGYDPQVVCTSCTLGPVASREVLVPLYIDCTRCTRVVYALERLYTFCYILPEIPMFRDLNRFRGPFDNKKVRFWS